MTQATTRTRAKTTKPTRASRTTKPAAAPAPAPASAEADTVRDRVLSAIGSTQDRFIERLRADAGRLDELAARGPQLPGSDRFPRPTQMVDRAVGVLEGALALSRRLVPTAAGGKTAG